MSASLKVLVPEATTNYIQNPSFRYGTTGWAAVGSTPARVLDHALYGISSLRVVTNGLAIREGVYYRVSALSGVNEPITVSVYARGQGTIQLRLWNTAGKEWVSESKTLHSYNWVRLEVSGFSTGTNDLRLYVETVGLKAVTFYVDGAQMERKAYSTTFCDGSQPGCRWNIMDSASVSSRDSNTRQGGRWVSIGGPCRDNNDIYITVLGGLGMPPIENNIQSWALTPGSYFQNAKISDRPVTISFNIKKESLHIVRKVDASPLHKLRQQLIDIFKPDLTGGNEPFLFSYQEGERELFLNMRYESGLEGSWDIRNQWSDAFPVRFLAVDPMLWENNYHAQAVNFKDGNIMYHAIARIDGRWSTLASGLDFDADDIEIGKYGEVYYVGSFTKDQLATVTLNRIGYWNGSTWNPIGLGTNGWVIDMAIAPNGDIYVIGTFTQAINPNGGVVAVNNIARWNVATSTWSALGTGLNDTGYVVEVAPNGDVYAGGAFTQAGGLNAYYIARWDGLAWRTVGATLGTNGKVYSIAISKDGTDIYIAGEFFRKYGSGTNDLLRVAKIDASSYALSQVGEGFDADVGEIRLSPAGILYAVGPFANSGTTAISKIAKWNESAWIALGDGVTEGGYPISMDISENEQVIVVGQFTHMDGIEVNGVAFWNGSSWTNLDIKYPRGTNDDPKAVLFVGEDIYIGGDNIATAALYSSINTVTNYGTAEVRPMIYVYGPGKLRWIENQTTKKRIYLDMTIFDNEEVFFDFGIGKVWSTVRGDLTYAVIPGSDFADFTLTPGDNTLAILMTDDVDSMMYIYYRPAHWSADSTVDAEEL